MAHSEELDHLLKELERVGVDPNTISAGLAVHPDDAMKALRELADGAGPAAFLAKLRQITPAQQHEHRDGEVPKGDA